MNPRRPLIMGVINASPESFYKGSVRTGRAALAALARRMEKDGADLIDIGAMSTAPYLETRITEGEEARRLFNAVRAVKKATRLPVSADTARATPATAALEAGATIINDVTGLHGDPAMAAVARRARKVIMMAHPMALTKSAASPVAGVRTALMSSMRLARLAGIPESKWVLDPGIGFFRDQKIEWWKWDVAVLRDLKRLAPGVPLLVGVSRKSFLGEILGGRPAEGRLAASLAASSWATLNGASYLRAHDVRETRDAIDVLERIRR